MTSDKHLKARIRDRMARTGERYTTARGHLHGVPSAAVDHGWTLRGGFHPDSAVLASHLADTGLSEAMLLGIGGGLGAGYILWEFARHDTCALVLGYRYRWNYLDWAERTLDRLGVLYRTNLTSGERAAATALTEVLDSGGTAIVWPDWQLAGYWHLPAHREGGGGHPVVAYAIVGDGVRVDDRNTEPLTVPRAALDRARSRIPSYRNRMLVLSPRREPIDLAAAVRAGIADCVAYLGADSTSFAVPAWRKWARLLTDTRNAKGWPRVFADGRGLTGALMSIWEGVEPIGMSGGHLRDHYAAFLDEAAPLIGPTATAAAAFRHAGQRWHDLAEAALPADVPEYARLRELTAAVAVGVAGGDRRQTETARVAAELWDLRAELDHKPPVPVDLAGLAARMEAVYQAEREAVEALRTIPTG